MRWPAQGIRPSGSFDDLVFIGKPERGRDLEGRRHEKGIGSAPDHRLPPAAGPVKFRCSGS